MDLVRTIPPAEPVLTLDDAKLHLRVESTDEDVLIEGLIDAALALLDGHAGLLGRCLITQTWQIRYDYCFPAWRIALPLSPLITVGGVAYVDSEGVTQTVSPALYQVLDGIPAAVQPVYGQAWPAPRSQARAVTITFTAGYGAAASDIPTPLLAAMKLLIGHFYAHREAVVGVEARDSSTPLPLGVEALIAPFRARSVA